ncbi:MAG TPA: peptidase M61 [Flavobacterium sp.]|jgi:predicted metalloprotease with PDZ domain
MKKHFFLITIGLLLYAPAFSQSKTGEQVRIAIDLNNVKDDKVMVTVTPPKISGDKTTYHIPKIIPGTYSEDDYGRFVEDLKAYDKKGKMLAVTKADDNSWAIASAKNLDKITYLVNDTYDTESTHDIFSPAGTNILDGKNFMLNMHGFVGYFSDMKELPYQVTVSHPAGIQGATSLIDSDNTGNSDVFTASRYAELVDNPIMYSQSESSTFTVDGMEIIISVYSPSGSVDAKLITPDIERMVRAQKKFLGPINQNKKYTILLYLSDMQKPDAKGFGALEHNTSTTVVFPEMMPQEQLVSALIDVVSHEFFHTVTPLAIHSKEIHYFDFNSPKMSQHLWMYEGITEYFANLFQVNQGLIDDDDFYSRMAGKMENASRMNDKMSFTTMSANVLKEPYKSQYLNVYEKGALIGMCLDIVIREKSNGQRGVLDLMQKLSTEYGATKPFDDNELFAKIVQLTYPEVGDFLNTYVAGETPIPYEQFFAKVGIAKAKKKVPANVFLKGQTPYITIKPGTKDIVVINGIPLNGFMKNIGLKGGDVITEINGKAYNLDNIYDMIMGSQNWKEGDAATVKINRDGKDMTLKGKVTLDYEETEGLMPTDTSKDKLREAWLRG